MSISNDKAMTDSFVIGYGKKNIDDDAALVVLRPKNSESGTEYDTVCSYRGDMADVIYTMLCGVEGADK